MCPREGGQEDAGDVGAKAGLHRAGPTEKEPSKGGPGWRAGPQTLIGPTHCKGS